MSIVTVPFNFAFLHTRRRSVYVTLILLSVGSFVDATTSSSSSSSSLAFWSSWTQPSISFLSQTNNNNHDSSSVCASYCYKNHLQDVPALTQSYFALRHGQSMANVAKIIASDPEIACTKYGLSDVGKEQASLAGEAIVREFEKRSYQGIIILTSDLLRAKQTAEIVAQAAIKSKIPLYKANGEGVSSDVVVIEKRLRERGFGDWDETSDENYHNVWKDDIIDPTHVIKDVESVVSVMDRATRCILDCEEKLQADSEEPPLPYMILCVAHGDVLQILQTAFEKLDGSKHRSLDHLETATLRPLSLATK